MFYDNYRNSVLSLTMNFLITLSKESSDPLGSRLEDPQLLWQCYAEFRDQQQDRRVKNWRQFVNFIGTKTKAGIQLIYVFVDLFPYDFNTIPSVLSKCKSLALKLSFSYTV